MKSVKGIAAVFVMFLFLITGRHCLASGNTYRVNVTNGYLALRSEKSFDARNEVGKLYTGDFVTVEDYSDSTYWYVYCSKLNKYGYVNKSYLEEYQEPVADIWTVSVKEGYLALRTGKSFDRTNEIGQLYSGDTVEVIDSSDSTYWYVYAPKLGKYGYVNKEHLISNNSCAETWKVKVHNGYLALRTEKSFDSANEIGQLYSGDTVEIQDNSDSTYWYVYAVKLNKYGYVNKNYLVAEASGVNSSSNYYPISTECSVQRPENLAGSVYEDNWYQITSTFEKGIAIHPIPDPDAEVTGRVFYEEYFHADARYKNYAYITHNGVTGWINTDYAKIVPAEQYGINSKDETMDEIVDYSVVRDFISSFPLHGRNSFSLPGREEIHSEEDMITWLEKHGWTDYVNSDAELGFPFPSLEHKSWTYEAQNGEWSLGGDYSIEWHEKVDDDYSDGCAAGISIQCSAEDADIVYENCKDIVEDYFKWSYLDIEDDEYSIKWSGFFDEDSAARVTKFYPDDLSDSNEIKIAISFADSIEPSLFGNFWNGVPLQKGGEVLDIPLTIIK